MPSQNGDNRIDRIERALELLINDHVQFREEHKLLLTAQVVLTDRLDRFIQATQETGKHTDQRLAELADKLNGLIGYIDQLPRPPRK